MIPLPPSNELKYKNLTLNEHELSLLKKCMSRYSNVNVNEELKLKLGGNRSSCYDRSNLLPSNQSLICSTANLLKQNQILINYKKLSHVQNSIQRSRSFIKRNFDLAHHLLVKSSTESLPMNYEEDVPADDVSLQSSRSKSGFEFNRGDGGSNAAKIIRRKKRQQANSMSSFDECHATSSIDSNAFSRLSSSSYLASNKQRNYLKSSSGRSRHLTIPHAAQTPSNKDAVLSNSLVIAASNSRRNSLKMTKSDLMNSIVSLNNNMDEIGDNDDLLIEVGNSNRSSMDRSSVYRSLSTTNTSLTRSVVSTNSTKLAEPSQTEMVKSSPEPKPVDKKFNSVHSLDHWASTLENSGKTKLYGLVKCPSIYYHYKRPQPTVTTLPNGAKTTKSRIDYSASMIEFTIRFQKILAKIDQVKRTTAPLPLPLLLSSAQLSTKLTSQ